MFGIKCELMTSISTCTCTRTRTGAHTHTAATFGQSHKKDKKKKEAGSSLLRGLIFKPFLWPTCRHLSQFLKCIFTIRLPHHTESCFWKRIMLRFGVMRLCDFFLFYWWCGMISLYAWCLRTKTKKIYSTIIYNIKLT